MYQNEKWICLAGCWMSGVIIFPDVEFNNQNAIIVVPVIYYKIHTVIIVQAKNDLGQEIQY